MKVIKLSVVVFTLIVVLLGLSCLENVPVEVKKSLVKVVLEGLDNEVEFVLPVGTYDFYASGTAGPTSTNITVSCHDHGTSALVAQASLTIPNSETGAEDGDTATGDSGPVAVTAAAQVEVTITLEWEGQAPDGWVVINLTFTGSPDIHTITMVPGFDWPVSRGVEFYVEATDYNGNPSNVSVEVEITDPDGIAQATAVLALNGGSGLFEGSIVTPGLADDYTITITVVDQVTSASTQVARAITIV